MAQTGAPAAALPIVDRLDLDDYQYLHSTRAELLHRLNRDEEAAAECGRALELATSEPERRYPRRRIDEIRP